ncbi:MAG: fimbrillin family protein, partial [Muribaculaceae bacterium]|nr:fimbrillin family protein [Muribaculaceae bacterium]
MNKYRHLSILAIASLLAGCSDDYLADGVNANSGNGTIRLSGEINQQAVTRVNDSGFADGDVMGVYIVDYNGTEPGTLLTNGNRGDNVRHTFNEAAYSWNSAYDLFWKDKHTKIDVYGYYPVGKPEDVNAWQFSIMADQSRIPSDGSMGNYEASDFLWGAVKGVEPTANVIRLPLSHRMANARVTLVEGDGFADGEWAATDRQVLVTNTLTGSLIDLATGTVTPDGDTRTTIIPSRNGEEWRAIVVPQTIDGGTMLFSITVGGRPYKFSKAESFTYAAGKMNNFTIRVDKKEDSGDYALTLVSESITPWENDLVSHDATAKEYVVIDVPEAGTLDECITKAGKDLTKLRNLKITGQINARDFAVMRFKMSLLGALNLKEVRIVAGESGNIDNDNNWAYTSNLDDEIPGSALNGKETLTNLVLPDRLKYIQADPAERSGAFSGCFNLSGSLTIPEGVEVIGPDAFRSCTSLTGTLSLPSTLKRIGSYTGYDGYWDAVFGECNFTCELILPDGLEEIGKGAFRNCRNLHGSLRLPDNLKLLGEGAFTGCENLSGNLEIPQGVTFIPSSCFDGCWFGGTLTLHDGITAIGTNAFANCGFRGELNLPKNLEVISSQVFYNNDFSGELLLPKGLQTIGDKAFAYNWRLLGTLEIPEKVISIGAGAFAHCRNIEGLIFPEGLESIRANNDWNEDGGAFQNCFGIGKIVCKGTLPAYVQNKAFDGVAKDNFVLEVPETAISLYQTAVGWCDFKRISAHHELVCRPAVACAISSEHKQTLVVDSEGEWVVDSKPDWCSLSANSGSKKTEVTLTIAATSKNSEPREGDVVFRLKGKDYTTRCHVSQYGYEYAEDEYLTLQKATKGNNGGINLVFLGDGYDAKEMSEGTYLADIKEGVEHFFGIEPYTTYRDYFNVYTAFPLSTETGVGSINTIRYNRFNTTYTGGVGLRCDYDEVFRYAMNAPTVTAANLSQTLIIIIPNSTDYGGICQMWEDGSAIAFCPKSNYGYPLDSRGVMQHEAGGHGFGKLGDEYIYHNAFIDFCTCTCCGHVGAIQAAKSL